jgi:hypothetical protein
MAVLHPQIPGRNDRENLVRDLALVHPDALIVGALGSFGNGRAKFGFEKPLL